jgi:hypothetical protein
MGDDSDIDEVEDLDETQELDDPEGPPASGAKSQASSNVGDASVEINVDDLIAELEADAGMQHPSDEQNSRKRLEVILEDRRAARELEELDDFALDEYETTD